MSIHFISGKPGGGKSLYSMRLLVDELLHGSRTIITNLPVKVGELNAYIQRVYPERNIDVCGRIRMFSEEEMKGFFTIRPEGSTGPKLLLKQEWEQGRRPDYSKITDKGVFYIVDEVHIGFNARQWAETGRDVLYYLSQHRKLGDTVICVTQAVNNVDKQFRSVTQDYTYIRNLSKEKMSKFRLPNLFVRQTFQNPPSGNEIPMETGTFKLDVSGLAACYDTAQGVGIHGKAGADITERKTGLPWWVFVAIVLVAVVLIAKIVPGMIANYFKAKSTPHHSVPAAPATVTNAPPKVATWQPTNAPAVIATNSAPELTVTMIDRLTGQWRVELSDGRILTANDPELEQINPRGAVVSGKLIKHSKPSPPQPTAQMASFSPEQGETTIPPRRIRIVPGENWEKQ